MREIGSLLGMAVPIMGGFLNKFLPSRRGFAVLILVLIAGGALFWFLKPRSAKRINVILITVETLRADHVGVYGYARDTTPNVDRFAKQATVFRQAYSQAPETNPSISSLMTSHYPHETKVLSVFHTLPPKALTMAKILKKKGYRTAAVISHDTLRRGSGFEQGFDTYDDRMEEGVQLKWGPNRRESVQRERIAPKTTRAAIKWLEKNYKDKFFLWVHYEDPHGPYTPPPPYNTMFLQRSRDGTKALPVLQTVSGTGGIPPYQLLGDHRDRSYYISQYDGEVRFFDQAFGELMEKIRELGLFENSLIIFTADHGEGMGEHGYYFAHRELVYNGLIHVPLIIHVPGKGIQPTEVQKPVALLDVLPTVLRILSVKPPDKLRGRDLFAAPAQRPIFSETETGGSKYTILSDDLKLIVNEDSSELYELSKDYSEQRDLIAAGLDQSLTPRAIELKNEVERIRHEDSLKLGKPVMWAVDPETINQLRALGYVQ